MLIGAMNPCPCGYYGDPMQECTCSHSMVSRYQKRISGPLLDRIDIHIEVPRVEYEKLSDERLGEPSAAKANVAGLISPRKPTLPCCEESPATRVSLGEVACHALWAQIAVTISWLHPRPPRWPASTSFIVVGRLVGPAGVPAASYACTSPLRGGCSSISISSMAA